MTKSFKSIMEYWQNKTHDDLCYNCSYFYVNKLCPCKIRSMVNDLKENEVIAK